MTSVTVFLFAALAVAVAVGMLRFFPEETRAAMRWFHRSRMFVVGVFWTLTALVFIASGSLPLMLAGVVLLVIVVLNVLIEDLHTKALRRAGL